MDVLRSFKLLLFIIALVAMEATISKRFKVGAKEEEGKEKEKQKGTHKKSKGTVSKSEGTLKRHR